MGIISEGIIRKWILPHLSIGKRGYKSKVDLVKVVSLILKRLKTGCQWRELSIKEYFPNGEITWQGVYYYFNKWSSDGSWKLIWINLLKENRQILDLSSIQLDGSHTPSKRGGYAVGYQGRKSCKTSNSLFLSDNQGQILSVSEPQSGNHNDLYNIVSTFEEMLTTLEEATINTKGLFLNADAGFDGGEFREYCMEKELEANIATNSRNSKQTSESYQYFDDQLYKRRYKIEQANAWMDSFKALIIRFETKAANWRALQWIAILVLFCKKLKD
ncbi:IS5 family transposase [[Flexibacter] sp. ATCC 35208]|nr:IS5 family transposase [[Flexibacter] sp. ATCC 35208]